MQLLGSTLAFVAAVLPPVILACIALAGHMIGEWGRGALLAYAAVLLGFLSGIGAAGSATGAAQALSSVGVVLAVIALFLGGPTGLSVLAVAYGLFTALVLVRPGPGLPWLLLAIAGGACLIAALRDRW
jgi:hypothetical protein